MNAKEYIESEYGKEHLKTVIQLNDETSLFALMDEYAEWKNKNGICQNVRVRYLDRHECDCGWVGNISDLYYQPKNEHVTAALECPICYTQIIKLR